MLGLCPQLDTHFPFDTFQALTSQEDGSLWCTPFPRLPQAGPSFTLTANWVQVWIPTPFALPLEETMLGSWVMRVGGGTCSWATDYTGHGILQARILEWVAFPFSRGSSPPRDRTQVSCTAGEFFTSWATRETYNVVDGGAGQEEDGKGSWIHWASEVTVIIFVCRFLIHSWLSESEVCRTGHVKRLWMSGGQLGDCKLEGKRGGGILFLWKAREWMF